MKRPFSLSLTLVLACSTLSGCVVPAPDSRPWLLDGTSTAAASIPSALQNLVPTPRSANDPYYTPTPDSPHALPSLRTDGITYTVQYGDYLSLIAQNYNLSVDILIAANPNIDPNTLEAGQQIFVPAPQARRGGL